MVMENSMEYFSGKRIVVTGASGYLATNLIKRLAGVLSTIVCVSRPGAVLQQFKGRAEIQTEHIDMSRSEEWQRVLRNADLIYHFAAQTSTYVANSQPWIDLYGNVVPSMAMLEACRRLQSKPIVVFASTVTISGLPQTIPVNEDFRDEPVTIYDIHKLTVEHLLRWYVEENFVIGGSLRLSNVYGPGPKSGSADRGILNQMIRKALGGESLTVYKPGSFLRDYVFVDDVVNAFLLAGESAHKLSGGFFVVGTGVGYSIRQSAELVADRVARLTGRKVDVQLVDPPEGLSRIEKRNFVADPARFQSLVGWKANYLLDEGIEKTIEAFS
jgi:UDP-glucose 4-epimerase